MIVPDALTSARLAAWLGRWIVRVFAGIGLAAVIIVGVQILTRASSQPDAVDVEQRWGDAIRQYGIEPVYPPEEDFSVGDVFVEVVNDADPDPSADTIKSSSPFRRRSVKIDHIDLRDELTAFYSMIPMFIDATPPAAGAPLTLFKQSEQALPLAAFPDVTASAEREAGASFFARLFGAFSFAGSSQQQAKLALRQVEAYGLTNVAAQQALDAYCSKPVTEKNCTEAVARRHVRSIIGVGERAYRQYIGANDGKPHYALELRLFIVSRVYLSRNIVGASRSAGARSGGAALSPPSAPAPPTGAPQSAPPATGSDTTAALAKLQAQLDELSSNSARRNRAVWADTARVTTAA